MKAFLDSGNLTANQKRFNYCLSRAIVVVEHAYGRLKGRWRCLMKRLDVSVCDVPELVAACCVLHNVCEVHGDRFNNEWISNIEEMHLRHTSLIEHNVLCTGIIIKPIRMLLFKLILLIIIVITVLKGI